MKKQSCPSDEGPEAAVLHSGWDMSKRTSLEQVKRMASLAALTIHLPLQPPGPKRLIGPVEIQPSTPGNDVTVCNIAFRRHRVMLSQPRPSSSSTIPM